jgi:hypothetical protein
MPHRAAVALVCVCLLAGCGGWTPFGSSTPEPLTPVSPEGETSDRRWVSGGNINPAVLAATHGRTLSTTNYTVRVEQAIQRANGSVLRRSLTYREVDRGDYRGYVRSNSSVPALQKFGTIAYWHNGTHTATRFNARLRPVRDGIWRTNSTGPVSDPSYSDRLRTLVAATDAELDGDVNADVVVISGSRPDSSRLFRAAGQLTDVRDASGQFRIRSDGVVVGWQFSYEASFQGERVRVRQTGRVSDIGTTTVRQPSWVENATNLNPES